MNFLWGIVAFGFAYMCVAEIGEDRVGVHAGVVMLVLGAVAIAIVLALTPVVAQ